MRTTLNLNGKLLQQAMKITGDKTKTSLIHFALEEIIRKNNLKRLLGYGGKASLEYQAAASRGRV